MSEIKIRETNITDDNGGALVRVVIADDETYEDANLYLAISIQSTADAGKTPLVQYQRDALKSAQQAIRAVVDDLERTMKRYDLDMD